MVRHGAADRLDLDKQRPRRQDICQTVLLKLLTSPRRFEEGAAGAGLGDPGDRQLLQGLEEVRLDPAAAAPGGGGPWTAVHLPELGGESPVLAAVQALPDRYRQAVYLRYYEGYEPAEIGELMGCTASQVSTYLYRGKAKLRKMLGGAYGQECLSE